MTEIQLAKTHHKFERIDSIAGRQYLVDGKYQFPSVTTILQNYGDKTALEQWKQRLGEKEAALQTKRATNRGTALHKTVENYINGNLDLSELRRSNPILYSHFTSIKPHVDEIQIVRGVEIPAFSPDLKVAGTLDLAGVIYDNESVIDFKTSSKPKLEEWILNYFLQETIYTIMLEHTYGIKAKQIVTIIAVDHDKPQVFVKNRDAYLKQAFDAIIQFQKGATHA